MLFKVLTMVIVLAVSIHLASYGLYAWRQEKNKRGAVGAFVIAWLTLITPVLMWLK